MDSNTQDANAGNNYYSMSSLPLAQRSEAWDRTEADFWRNHNQKRRDRYHSAAQRWRQDRDTALNRVQSLENRRRQFTQEEEDLNRELMAVRSRAAHVERACNQEKQRLKVMEANHAVERQEILRKENSIEASMRDWFKKGRNQDGVPKRPWPLPELIDKRPPDRKQQLPSLANLDLPRQALVGHNKIVALIDLEGKIIDKLRYPGLSNERTTSVSAFLVRRPVKIYEGQRFYDRFAPNIYECTDGKAIGWLACMIQATGFIQEKPCQSCASNEAPFHRCIVVGGSLFPKCGNCEWNHRGCHGLDPVQPPATNSRTVNFLAPLRIQEAPATATSPSLARLRLDSPPSASMEAMAAAAEEACDRASQVANRNTTPTLSGFTAVNAQPSFEIRSPRIERFDFSASMASPREESNTSSGSASRLMTPLTAGSIESAEQGDITQDTLILRHDGTKYIYPKCVEDVPLQKIHPGHPYWDPKWPDLQQHVEPLLCQWEQKLQEANEAYRRGEKIGSVKYQYGRQVNRGKRILDFLATGVISPYQLLNKRFMSVGKGSITSYDTLFRLCETISELARYKIDVEPVEWLRQRLHQLIEVHGAAFNFAKTIHDFYNDPKLAALRDRSGFKSIGRPSGMRVSRRSSIDGSRARKRKSPHLYGTPSPAAESSGEAGDSAEESQGLKRQKAAASVLDSLETGEVSETDSLSGAPIKQFQFRVHQVKTRLFTSPENVTQYWSWVPKPSMFKHELLTGTEPVVWGIHDDPIDFSLQLEDVFKIKWNLKSLRVHLVMSGRQICFEDDKPRGDVIVAFKRENTMRRFIRFCRDENIDLVEETWKKMEDAWAGMVSEQLPGGSEEADKMSEE